MVKRLLLIVALVATLVACGPGNTQSPSLQSLDIPSASPSLDVSPSLDASPSDMEESPSASPS